MEKIRKIFNTAWGYSTSFISGVTMLAPLAGALAMAAAVGSIGVAIGTAVGVVGAIFINFAEGMATTGDARSVGTIIWQNALCIGICATVVGALAGGIPLALTAAAVVGGGSALVGVASAGVYLLNTQVLSRRTEEKGVAIALGALVALGGAAYAGVKTYDTVKDLPIVVKLYDYTDSFNNRARPLPKEQRVAPAQQQAPAQQVNTLK